MPDTPVFDDAFDEDPASLDKTNWRIYLDLTPDEVACLEGMAHREGYTLPVFVANLVRRHISVKDVEGDQHSIAGVPEDSGWYDVDVF